MSKFEFKKQPVQQVVLDETAVKIAVKIIKAFEGCVLFSYPDPASPLYKALSTHGMLAKYLAGKIRWKDLPEHFQALSGAPFTIGYGQTGEHVTKDTVWTEQQAAQALEEEVRKVMAQCLKDCTKLVGAKAERVAAITSLAFNIGGRAFRDSTACRLITSGQLDGVPAAIKMFDKAGGKVMAGLTKRRQIEADLWNCV